MFPHRPVPQFPRCYAAPIGGSSLARNRSPAQPLPSPWPRFASDVSTFLSPQASSGGSSPLVNLSQAAQGNFGTKQSIGPGPSPTAQEAGDPASQHYPMPIAVSRSISRLHPGSVNYIQSSFAPQPIPNWCSSREVSPSFTANVKKGKPIVFLVKPDVQPSPVSNLKAEKKIQEPQTAAVTGATEALSLPSPVVPPTPSVDSSRVDSTATKSQKPEIYAYDSVEVVARAILSSPNKKSTTVSIYRWIEEKMPNFIAERSPTRWKDSVRKVLKRSKIFDTDDNTDDDTDGKPNWKVNCAHLDAFEKGNFSLATRRAAKRRKDTAVQTELSMPSEKQLKFGIDSILTT